MVEEFEIKKIPISLIKFDESNPNELSNEQMESLKLTMEKYGYLAPVILNKDFTIVDGEHRVRIYQELGKQEIQAYVIDVDQIDLKILRQLMNKLRGEHDKQKDANEFKSIFDAGKLDEFSKLLAKPKEEFESILEKKFNIDFVKEEDPIPEIPRETKVKLGDIYQLGNHRVMCGDCTIKENVDKLLEGKTVDLLLTDPPYGISVVAKNGKIGGGNICQPKQYKQILGDDKPFNPKFILGYGIKQVIFGANYFANELPQKSGWLVWNKRKDEWGKTTFADCELAWTNLDSPARVYTQVWMGLVKDGETGQLRVHPTQKPIRLFSQLIKDFSQEDNLVLDTFLGSGSTLIACESTNRVCYGMELDPFYVDVIIQRWENYTGKKAVKL